MTELDFIIWQEKINSIQTKKEAKEVRDKILINMYRYQPMDVHTFRALTYLYYKQPTLSPAITSSFNKDILNWMRRLTAAQPNQMKYILEFCHTAPAVTDGFISAIRNSQYIPYNYAADFQVTYAPKGA